jgi:DNA-binding transcriptional MerR regulator
MDENKYTIEDLTERTGFSRRTIRYYIQESLLEPPAGRGRGGFYFDSHLSRLLEIRSLQDRGLRLTAIREVLGRGERTWEPPPSGTLRKTGPSVPGALEREIWIRYPVAPGVEVHVARDVEEARRKEVLETVRLARSLLEEKDEGGSHG